MTNIELIDLQGFDLNQVLRSSHSRVDPIGLISDIDAFMKIIEEYYKESGLWETNPRLQKVAKQYEEFKALTAVYKPDLGKDLDFVYSFKTLPWSLNIILQKKSDSISESDLCTDLKEIFTRVNQYAIHELTCRSEVSPHPMKALSLAAEEMLKI